LIFWLNLIDIIAKHSRI